jgi:hypothetical protein
VAGDLIIGTQGSGAGIILDAEDDTIEFKQSGTVKGFFDTNGLTIKDQLDLRLEESGSGCSYIAMQAAACMAANYTITWPAAVAGTCGFALKSTTAGVLSWGAAGGGASTREGGNTTESTTTSTSAVDLISAASLTIAAAQPFQITAGARKTTGASGRGMLGIKENCTVIWDAETGAISAGIWRSGTGNAAENGSADNRFSSRVTNYVHGKGTGNFMNYDTSGAYVDTRFALTYAGICGDATMVMGTDEITSFTIRGEIADSAITLGTDEFHIYSWAIS